MKESSRKIYVCDPSEVVVKEGRTRQTFDQAKLRELANSLKSGTEQIQPGVCVQEEDKIVLVAGERRLRACQLAGMQFEFILRDAASQLLLLEIEVQENFMRVDLDFKEQCAALERLHLAYQESQGKFKKPWTQRETAGKLKCSVGNVNEALEVAAFVRHSPEVAGAKNITEAKKIIKKRKEQINRTLELERARIEARQQQEEGEGEREKVPEGEKTPEQEFVEQVAFFSPKILRGKMEEKLLDFPDEYFDLVIWDPPWGVDFDEVMEDTGSKEKYKDKKEWVWERLPSWLELVVRKMAPHSHLYLFFGIVNHQKIYDLVESQGLVTNRMPLTWHKLGSRRTRDADKWPGRCYEPILYARKGNKNLVVKGMQDIIPTPTPTPAMKQDHPSAKHPDVFKSLLERSAMPGDKILDPMAGSGMMGVACEYLRPTHQLQWVMIEEKSTFADLSVKNLIKGYHEIVTSQFKETSTCSTDEQMEDGAEFYQCEEGHVGNRLEAVMKKGKLTCPECGKKAQLCRVQGGEMKQEEWMQLQVDGKEWREYWEKHPQARDAMFAWATKG